MDGYQKLCVLMLCIAALFEFASSSTKESRTGGLHIPEKIIGGVIDIVQSHKNKPVQGTQVNYPPNQNFNYQQYPQYQQQWSGQSNFQSQGFQTQTQPQPQPQGQYQTSNPGQYSYQSGYNQAGNFQQVPQNSGNYNPTYPASSGQTFTQGQNQQNQYQVVYQNPNQFAQTNNQFQNSQSGYYNGQSQNNQFQGSSTGMQGQTGQTQGSASSGQFTQGFLTTGGQSGNGNGQGPTCVCQAWTKPQQNQEIYGDTPVTEKPEKKEETS